MRKVRLRIYDWDDNVFEHSTEFRAMFRTYWPAAAEAVLGLSLDNIRNIMRESSCRLESSTMLFSKFVRSELLEEVHHRAHEIADLSWVSPKPGLAKRLARVNQGIIAPVLSHGSNPYIYRSRDRLGLGNNFKNEDVFGLERVGFAYKTTQKPYKTVLGAYGCYASEAEMSEDRHILLKAAHELGIQTIWTKWDGLSEIPPYVDRAFRNFDEYLTSLEGEEALLSA